MQQQVYLELLHLHNYRNFTELELILNNGIVMIIGENGSGKTNILEAISLLSPGRGIRGAKYEDIVLNQSDTRAESWSIGAKLQSKIGTASIKSSFAKSTHLRTIEYNGSKITNSELGSLINVIWLTPQMDGIFLDSGSGRRKYLDRIVYNFYPEHAGNINQYNHLTSERLKLLTNFNTVSIDDMWLKVLEEKIAEVALKINDLRIKTIAFLQEAIDKMNSPFPKATISVSSLFSDIKIQQSDFVESYLNMMRQGRIRDRVTKRTNFGINKQELEVVHTEKDQNARLCSTGEQKALLISILLGQIEACKSVTKNSPVLLLDELFTHLDNRRKNFLADIFTNSGLQTFITCTDFAGLDDFVQNTQVIYV